MQIILSNISDILYYKLLTVKIDNYWLLSVTTYNDDRQGDS
jgi:hypothetical protein